MDGGPSGNDARSGPVEVVVLRPGRLLDRIVEAPLGNATEAALAVGEWAWLETELDMVDREERWNAPTRQPWTWPAQTRSRM